MKHSFFLGIFLFFGLICKSQLNLVPNYIMLEYNGKSTDKPIFQIYFSTEAINFGSDFWGLTYKVDKCDFLAIKNSIEECEAVRQVDTTQVGYYNFSSTYNHKTRLFKANNVAEVSIVFSRIENQITDKKIRKAISVFFKDILSRIK